MEWILGVLVGIAATVLISRFITKSWSIGVLKINLRDPEADICGLAIDSDINDLVKKKFVVLKVDSQN